MKKEHELLMIPGPTPVPPASLKAMAQPMFNHRGPRFAKLLEEVTEKLKEVISTKERLFILPASGTGAMEAAVANTINPGDKVLCVSIGIFGDRFRELVEAFGGKPVHLDVELGHTAKPEAIKAAVRQHKPKAVLLTHNETSTGVTNPLQEIAEAVRDEALLLVDGVSSIGSIPYYHDKWGIDCLATASQKGLMTPPGLAINALSKRGWEAVEACKNSRYYFDLRLYEKYYTKKKQTPSTPALPQFVALNNSLDLLLSKGMENVYRSHVNLAQAFRAGVQAQGLTLFAKEGHSSTVTAVNSPVDSKALVKLLREKHHVEIAGGQGPLEGKIFRVAHMGFISPADILSTLKALESSLNELGFPAKNGVPAAKKVLDGL